MIHSQSEPANAPNDVTSRKLLHLVEVSRIFWFTFCLMGGSGDMLSIFIYSDYFDTYSWAPNARLAWVSLGAKYKSYTAHSHRNKLTTTAHGKYFTGTFSWSLFTTLQRLRLTLLLCHVRHVSLHWLSSNLTIITKVIRKHMYAQICLENCAHKKSIHLKKSINFMCWYWTT